MECFITVENVGICISNNVTFISFKKEKKKGKKTY